MPHIDSSGPLTHTPRSSPVDRVQCVISLQKGENEKWKFSSPAVGALQFSTGQTLTKDDTKRCTGVGVCVYACVALPSRSVSPAVWEKTTETDDQIATACVYWTRRNEIDTEPLSKSMENTRTRMKATKKLNPPPDPYHRWRRPVPRIIS